MNTAERSIIDGLNDQQREAVLHTNGPILIVAGAGTGKTTVITRRIAHLIQSGQATSDEILALTFTDKAAGEMEERVQALLPLGFFDLWISTFHAFGERILQDHALDIGLPNNFRLLTETDQWLLLREHIDELELEYYKPKGNPTKFVQALISHFSRLKDEDITPEQYLAYAEQLQLNADSEIEQAASETMRIREVARAYKHYQDLLHEKGAMDFGDLITETIHLFHERPTILEAYRKQFKYILVDEFQDTNYAQYDLIKLLAAPRNNLTVVADDDQSIYHFRGASMSNILLFKEEFPQSTEISLIENYRSPQNILDIAYESIQHNNPNRLEQTLHIEKRLQAQFSEPGIIEHLHAESVEGEAHLVIKKMIELREADPNSSWNDFAILVRANDHAQTFFPYLDRAHIPYQFFASKGLFSKPIILDVIAFLKLLDNYHESRALYRVLTYEVWDIPHGDLMRLVQYAHKQTLSFFEACQQVRSIPQLAPSTIETIERILHLIEKLTAETRRKTVGQIALMFLEESGYLKYITRAESKESIEALSYLNQFYKTIEAFERSNEEKTVRNFVQELALLLESGERGRLQPSYDEGPECVRIMTVHAAKGLEFRYVFVVNLIDKRFPTIGRKETIPIPDALIKDVLPEGDWHLQEERRLFYVALTRAKEGLFLTSAEQYGGSRKRKPSRFLLELGFVDTTPQPTGKVLFTPYRVFSKEETQQELQHVPKTFSFTQLKAYETCPWQYRFSFLLKVPVPGKPSFSFGKTMHTTLYEFFRQMKERSENPQGSLFNQTSSPQVVSAPSQEDLLQLYESHWIGEWYYSQAQQKEYKEKGKEALKQFYALHQEQWPNVLFLEKGFHVNVGAYTIKGAIDRVDRVDGGVEVIDYKTGAFPKTGKKDREQLYMYAMALREVFKEEPVKLSYYFVEENKTLSTEPNEDEYRRVTEWVLQLVEGILSGDFSPQPGFHCNYCDYKDICEFRAQ